MILDRRLAVPRPGIAIPKPEIAIPMSRITVLKLGIAILHSGSAIPKPETNAPGPSSNREALERQRWTLPPLLNSPNDRGLRNIFLPYPIENGESAVVSEGKLPTKNPAELLADLVVILEEIDAALPSARGGEKQALEQGLARLRATLSPAPENRATTKDIRAALDDLRRTAEKVLGRVHGRPAKHEAESVQDSPAPSPELSAADQAEMQLLLNRWPEVREELLRRHTLEENLPPPKQA